MPLPTTRIAVSVAELGAMLGISRDLAHRVARQVGVKVGSRRLIPMVTVDALLNGTLHVNGAPPSTETTEATGEVPKAK